MQEFRTTFPIPENKIINHKTPMLSLGSCFSENIGAKLKTYKFPVLVNPFGILYNPESIAQSIDILLDKKVFLEQDLFEHQGVYNSFYHHSRFSDTDKNQCLRNINLSLNQASQKIKQAKVLLITFGTAWVYQLKENQQIVSNCHKVPSKQFTRFKLSTHTIINRYTALIERLHAINPTIKIVFTVSPVRHLKDGAFENQLSKATLIMAVQHLVSNFKSVFYFPSYEIMMDDLRDYRFYNDDMIHPSPTAINYIWDKFIASMIHENSETLLKDIEKLNQAVNHRPFQVESEAHQKFLKATIKSIDAIESKENIDFSAEKKILEDQLIK